MAGKRSVADLERLCAPIAERMGVELTEVCLEKENTGKYLRFYIDRPEGISLDDCEAFHKAVRDLAEPVDFDFMEVSSPGIDRPLKKDRDFERHLGEEIEIHLYRPRNGSKLLTGILAGLEDGEILLDTPDGEVRVPRKEAALVKPVVSLEGIEDVDLTGDGSEADSWPEPEAMNNTEESEESEDQT